ncbi:MAG: hypothetical protein VX593_11020 [Pseudomonadota bacterium]|nr:hypothetical protein [Pseudomonadota bacterium]
MIRSIIVSASALIAAAGAPSFAQQPVDTAEAQAAAPAQAPLAIQKALSGLHVAVLQNSEGGVVTVQNENGDNALVAFLEPAAATEAQENAAIADMTVSTLPLLSMFATWQGPVVFEGSASARDHANQLEQEVEQGFGAPAFFVLADGVETQVDAGAGPITPILLSYDDATKMATQVREQATDAQTVEIVPIEFGAILKELSVMEEDLGYRVFTHPDTVALIQSAEAQREGASQQ